MLPNYGLLFYLFRFSETDAMGWDCFFEERVVEEEKNISEVIHKPELDLNFDTCLQNLLQSCETKENIWIELEKVRSLTEFTPFVGNHDECEDTERIVLFDDITFALFNLQNVNLQFQLVLSYLFLLGVPIPKDMLKPKVWNCFSIYFITDNISRPCFCHSQLFCHYVLIKSVLFTASNLTNNIAVLKIKEIFSQALKRFPNKYVQLLSKVWFHFESMLFRQEFENITRVLEKSCWKKMRKFIKRLLKLVPNRSCIELWVMYALYEWNLGNFEDAKKIFLTASQLMLQEENVDYILHISSIVRFVCLHFVCCQMKSKDIYFWLCTPENMTHLPRRVCNYQILTT